MGLTNAGKTSLINKTLKTSPYLLNISAKRETAHLWEIQLVEQDDMYELCIEWQYDNNCDVTLEQLIRCQVPTIMPPKILKCKDINDLKQEIKKLSRSQTDSISSKIHTVVIKIPYSQAKGFNDMNFKIVDAPGIDDDDFVRMYQTETKYFNFMMIPIIVFNLQQGAIGLTPFQTIKTCFKNRNNKVLIVFTNFKNFMNNNKQELSDSKDGEDVEDEEVLTETQKKINDYK